MTIQFEALLQVDFMGGMSCVSRVQMNLVTQILSRNFDNMI